MDSHKTAQGASRPVPPVDRHCSVCFAPIADASRAARSPEGHHYCAACADVVFKARQQCARNTDRKAPAAEPPSA
jgi:hypothetical protein